MTDKDGQDEQEWISKSQRKRDSHARQALGESLVELSEHQLASVPMPDGLRDAVDAARRIRQRGARKRQLQYIGRLMRDIDPAPIHAAVQAIEGHDAAATAGHKRLEHWRERLLDQGDEALGEALDQFPGLEPQRVRQYVRQARSERNANRPPKAARALFRYLREQDKRADD